MLHPSSFPDRISIFIPPRAEHAPVCPKVASGFRSTTEISAHRFSPDLIDTDRVTSRRRDYATLGNASATLALVGSLILRNRRDRRIGHIRA